MNNIPTGDSGTRQDKNDWFAGKLIRFFTVLIALLTLCSAFGASVNPSKFWFFAFTSLGFPILFVLNFLLLAIWILRRRKFALIPLIVFLLTVSKIPTMVQWNLFNDKPDFVEGQSAEINVMSFNVRLFDLYNWSNSNSTRAKIFNLIESEDPAILCLQEFYTSERKNQHNLKNVKETVNYKYYHTEYPINLYGTDHYGIATFSKFPILKKGVLYFDKTTANICIFTDINILTDTIRVYNCHLQSVRFGEKDYKFIESIGNDKEDESSGEEAAIRTKTILSRLKNAFVKRSGQVDMIAEHIRQSPHPVVICGDFNDTPISYTYHTISQGLKDAFQESGNGIGTTYAGHIPGLRIDYILHSPELYSYDYFTDKQKLSDHYAIGARLILKK